MLPDAHDFPPTKRVMVFVDGENLVARYQETLAKGFTPRDDLVHEKDVFVWAPSFTNISSRYEITRVTYYTYVVGDNEKVIATEDLIKRLNFTQNSLSLTPNSVTPCVFKKPSKGRKAKGVDIKMCVDILSHVYKGNVDAVHLLGGDGDFGPLIDEVVRSGVQVYLSAFRSGFNRALKNKVDLAYEIDNTTWLDFEAKKHLTNGFS